MVTLITKADDYKFNRVLNYLNNHYHIAFVQNERDACDFFNITKNHQTALI